MTKQRADVLTLRRGELAGDPRTLVDILLDTVRSHPQAPALDNGVSVLTYVEFAQEAGALAEELAEAGVLRGDRVGVRIRSGSTDLYVAITGILLAGAAYVPVDADDPPERADMVFGEAGVCAVVGEDLVVTPRGARRTGRSDAPTIPEAPEPDDDAWIIFTSGSTGTPKGVAVSHRSAAAFVDAERRLFLQDRPIGPGDRVMAGLSVAFDASCEEMWLAWAYGACLVPAPRSLVRSGMDLGPWLVANRITIVSTVPTLVSLWPADALAGVRLLILGGEPCPPEIGARLASEAREVWNTYGPTEATVVACAARLDGTEPVRIGLPLDGWDLAVVDAEGVPVPAGTTGELVIGGVGLARYLDPAKDAEKYAPCAPLGWDRAYRSGDLVRDDGHGLVFVGRVDDQVKVGGRRIELGEIDNALLVLPGVTGAAAAVRQTASGTTLLVGYLAVDDTYAPGPALALLRERLPAPLVPRLAVVEDLPTRTSGKIDRDALPWPLPEDPGADEGRFDEAQARLRDLWVDVIGSRPHAPGDDFFDLGGGSLSAARLVSRLRATHPEVTVADIYTHPTLAGQAAYLREMATPTSRLDRDVRPVPRKTQRGQYAALVPLRTLSGLRWCTYAAAGANLGAAAGLPYLPTLSWWWIALGWLLLIFAPGRMALTALGARIILRGIGPGSYPRGGKVHLRVWLAERLAEQLGAGGLSGAVLMRWYARLLGARVGRDVDLHAVPPVTGMLTLGRGCSVEPEVDLSGHWLDGDRLLIGRVVVGRDARVGARSTLGPGTRIGSRAEVMPGSNVLRRVPAGQRWSGAPAAKVGPSRVGRDPRPPESRLWRAMYAAMSIVISLLPAASVACGIAVLAVGLRATDDLEAGAWAALVRLPAATLTSFAVLAVLVLLLVRALGTGLQAGRHPMLSRPAWHAWATMRVLDEARTWLFPLYSSTLTPGWLRLLGARIGRDVEASTVLMIPTMTTVGEGAFLADDTLIGGYELGGGWLRVGPVKVGKQAFVGNSGMAAPGRKVPKRGLVAVLSAAPRRGQAKAGTSWIGSPPARLRRSAGGSDATRTTDPPARLRAARAAVEACRLVPVVLAAGLGLGCVVALFALAGLAGWWLAALASGLVLAVAGVLGAVCATAAKWLLVGRVRRGEYPLWSSFVWRNELADTFVEYVAAPWFARYVSGTHLLIAWQRTMGARIGTGVWCESYWLCEADLVDLRDGVTINPGCVVQTHLFHDRVLATDTVTLRAGSTLGPNSVVLPAAVIGRHATIGPASLVMRGESVPDQTRWIGNPIGPWTSQ